MAARVADTTTSLPSEEAGANSTSTGVEALLTEISWVFEADGGKDQGERRLLADRQPEIAFDQVREGADGNGGPLTVTETAGTAVFLFW